MGWLRDILGRSGAAGTPVTRDSAAPTPDDWRRRGNEALGAGQLEQAAWYYAQGLEADPGDATLRLNLGFVLLEQGNSEAAIERISQALALRRPRDAFVHEAQYLLGRAHAAQNRLTEALASFEAALQARPDFAEALEEGVRTLDRLQRHGEAARWARELSTLRPSRSAQLLLAKQLFLAGELRDALETASRVCEADPSDFEASAVRFDTLMKLGRTADALAEAERALIAGRSGWALVNVAIALHKFGRLDEALARLEEALAREPGHLPALINKISVQLSQLRVAEAAETARAGLALHPDSADLHWNLAIACLLLGDFETGWRESEWRLRSTAHQGRVELDRPNWQGESLEGRTILLYGEQGFGDTIQFVRYVSLVAARARQVYLMVQPELEMLADGLAPNCELFRRGSQLPPIDFHCSLLSLPERLGTTVETVPAPVSYLRADPLRVRAWRDRLGQGVHIGIAWAGQPTHGNDHNRSLPVEVFQQIDVPGCRFVTLQPKLRDADRATLRTWPQVLDLGAQMRDFGDTAALIQALDLVISVDTSVVHLAGALGKPVWILLPYSPDWRWMLEREDSPWYPTARLYRQPQPQSWVPVLSRVRDDLAGFVEARAALGDAKLQPAA